MLPSFGIPILMSKKKNLTGGFLTGFNGLRWYTKFDTSNVQEVIGTGTSGTNYTAAIQGAANYVIGKINNGIDWSLTNASTLDSFGVGVSVGVGQPFTIAFWVNLITAPAGYNAFWVAGVGTGLYHKSGLLVFYNGGDKNSTGTLTTGSYQYVVVTYDGTTLAFYINNVATGTVAGGSIALNMEIMGYNTVTRLNGAMDEVALWNRVLTSVELATLYNSGAGLGYAAW